MLPIEDYNIIVTDSILRIETNNASCDLLTDNVNVDIPLENCSLNSLQTYRGNNSIFVTDEKPYTGTSFSSGVLPKWDFFNRKYMIKRATFRNGEFLEDAFNEAKVYQLCQELKIDCAEYYSLFIVYYDFELRRYIIAPATLTKIFAGALQYYYRLRSKYKYGDVNSELIDFTDMYPKVKRKLHDMLLIDYLIGNSDRHGRNFGLIEDDLSPLYDSGASFNFDGVGFEVRSKAFTKNNYEVLEAYMNDVYTPDSVNLDIDGIKYGDFFNRRLQNVRRLYT
jgi:hypothetical protein